jgi:hypothetical protein
LKIKRLKSDRSGLSTVVTVVVVIVVIIVAAAGVYFAMSGDDEEKEILAPGTKATYSIDFAGFSLEFEAEYIGQSADLYFVHLTPGQGILKVPEVYDVQTKSAPEGAKVSVVTIDTFEGEKTLERWEFSHLSSSGATIHVIDYVDPVGMLYKSEITESGLTQIHELTGYTPVWQKSFEVSEYVGATYEYTCTKQGQTFGASIECIADCFDGYGVEYVLSEIEIGDTYYLSASPQGLPVDAEDLKKTEVLTTTIDGSVTTQLWGMTDEVGRTYTFYYDPVSDIVYRFVLIEGSEEFVFDLSKRPE